MNMSAYARSAVDTNWLRNKLFTREKTVSYYAATRQYDATNILTLMINTGIGQANAVGEIVTRHRKDDEEEIYEAKR